MRTLARSLLLKKNGGGLSGSGFSSGDVRHHKYNEVHGESLWTYGSVNQRRAVVEPEEI